MDHDSSNLHSAQHVRREHYQHRDRCLHIPLHLPDLSPLCRIHPLRHELARAHPNNGFHPLSNRRTHTATLCSLLALGALPQLFTLLLATAVGATLALVMWYDALIESGARQPSAGQNELSKVDSFKQSMKLDALEKEIDVDFAKLLGGVSPAWLVAVVLAVWVDFVSLGVYLARLGWKGARGLLRGVIGGAPAPPSEMRMDGLRGTEDASGGTGVFGPQGVHGVHGVEANYGMSRGPGIQEYENLASDGVNAAQDSARGVWISWGY
ncbi:hypothetical protein BDV09DRAFT_175151 [Aspergillus tetrazonus]